MIESLESIIKPASLFCEPNEEKIFHYLSPPNNKNGWAGAGGGGRGRGMKN
jgi:hypothetical protein